MTKEAQDQGLIGDKYKGPLTKLKTAKVRVYRLVDQMHTDQNVHVDLILVDQEGNPITPLPDIKMQYMFRSKTSGVSLPNNFKKPNPETYQAKIGKPSKLKVPTNTDSVTDRNCQWVFAGWEYNGQSCAESVEDGSKIISVTPEDGKNQVIGYWERKELGTVSVKKIWKHGDYPYAKPKTLEVNLVRGSDSTKVVQNTQLKRNDDYKGDFKDVPLYEWKDNKVQKITDYTVTEEKFSGSDKFKDPVVSGSMDKGFTITNTISESVVSALKTDITVTKVWDDAGNKENTRPENITFVLKEANGTEYKVTAGKDDKIEGLSGVTVKTTQNTNNTWTIKISDLPMYYANGKAINYTVSKENAVDGYAPATIDDKKITNKLETKDVTVNKVWNVGNGEGQKYKTDVRITLYADGKATNHVASLNGIKLSETFKDLPVKNASGKDIVYTAKEDRNFVNANLFDITEEGLTVTNKLKVSEALKDVTVNKVWNVGNGEGQKYKTNVRITLYADGKATNHVANLNGTKLSETFKGLLVNNSKGEAIKYTVKEDRDFTNADLFEITEEGLTVTNKLNFDEVNKIDNLTITVKKEWKNNISGLNIPKELKVDIKKLAGTDLIATLTLNKDNNWTATTGTLNKYDSNGNFISYTVTEEDIPGFKLKEGINTTVKGGSANVVGETEKLSLRLINEAENGADDGKIKINIQKVDAADNGKGLGGARFNITSVDEAVTEVDKVFMKTVTSKADGMIENIKLPKEGCYRITETKAPQGYMPGNDVIIKIAKDNQNQFIFYLYSDKNAQGELLPAPDWQLVVLGNGETVPTFKIENTKIENGNIYKIDDSGTPLSGAKFDLYKKVSTAEGYTISAEVDNSEIPEENIDVTVQLFKKSGEAEATLVENSEKKLTTSHLHDDLATNLVPVAGEKYYATFTFSGKFSAESIVFDVTRNTFVLKLVLNTEPQQQPGTDDSGTEGQSSQENGTTPQPETEGEGAVTNTENSDMTTITSIPTFTAPAAEGENAENTTPDTETANPNESATTTKENTEQATQPSTTDDGSKATEGTSGEANTNTEGQQTETISDNSGSGEPKEDANQQNSEKIADEAPPLTPLVYDTITKQSEMVELSGDYTKYQEEPIVSGEGGLIRLPNLPDGSYYLLETEVPNRDGGYYKRETKRIRFDIINCKISISEETEAGENSIWLKRKAESNSSGAEVITYRIINQWIPDSNTGNNNNPGGGGDNNDSNPFIPPLPTEPDASNIPEATIDDNDTPLSTPKDTPADLIEDEDVILADDEDILEDEVPLADIKKEEELEIDAEDVPLSDIPKTSDRRTGILYMLVLMAGLLLTGFEKMKKKEDK